MYLKKQMQLVQKKKKQKNNYLEETYEKIERKEFWLDSSEMLKLGIVDEIL